MILLISAVVLGVFWFGLTIYNVLRINKASAIGGQKFEFNRELLVKMLPLMLAQGFLTIASSYGLVMNGGWHLEVYEHFLIIFGS